jgi:hypothetical protein
MKTNTYRAHIHSTDNKRVCILTVKASDLTEAAQHGIAKAALNLRYDPRQLIAAHIHQQTPA